MPGCAAASPAATSFAPPSGVFNGSLLPTIINRVQFTQATNEPLAHGGGQIHGRIAGNVSDTRVGGGLGQPYTATTVRSVS